MSRVVVVAAGVVIVLMGLVWTLQGIGSELAPQSFMTNDGRWTLIGLATIAGGVIFIWWGLRRKA